MLKKVLIVYVSPHIQYLWSGYGHAFRCAGYEIAEIPFFLTNHSSENNSEILVNLLIGRSKNKFDLMVVFDEYEEILKSIKNLIPTKVPVFYVDVFREVKEVEGLTWFEGLTLPSEIIKEANKILRR
ncbi:MAG TPA: hypothetical protein VLH94_02660 [Spirochaetia bacterium]|nr:hypothetical protein [Spirochaetia bacterium]